MHIEHKLKNFLHFLVGASIIVVVFGGPYYLLSNPEIYPIPKIFIEEDLFMRGILSIFATLLTVCGVLIGCLIIAGSYFGCVALGYITIEKIEKFIEKFKDKYGAY